MSMESAEFTEKLIPISEFNQERAGKVFSDIDENNNEYIVLRDNRPTAVLLSVKEYKETQKKMDILEKLLERLEDFRLLSIAEEREGESSHSFEEFIANEGYSMDELEKLSENVIIE